MKTLKNKIMATSLILLGYLSTKIEGDGTFFIFTLLIGVPLFFEKTNWIDI